MFFLFQQGQKNVRNEPEPKILVGHNLLRIIPVYINTQDMSTRRP